jgi:cyanophycinase
MKLFFFVFLSAYGLVSFGQQPKDGAKTSPRVSRIIKGRPASIGIIGDTTDVKTSTTAGSVLMGGSTDVDAAFKWMLNRIGHRRLQQLC